MNYHRRIDSSLAPWTDALKFTFINVLVMLIRHWTNHKHFSECLLSMFMVFLKILSSDKEKTIYECLLLSVNSKNAE